MTTGEILLDVWKRLGEPTDLNPGTVTGRANLLVGVNKGLMATASFKDGLYGRQLRFNHRLTSAVISYSPYETTVGTGATVGVIPLASLPTGETDLTDCILEVGGEQRLIIATAAGSVYLDEDLSSAPDAGDEAIVHMKWIRVPTTYRILNVLKVDDVTNGSSLERAAEVDTFSGNYGQVGTPAVWQRLANRKLIFDVANDTATRYRVWLYVLPDALTVDGSEPDIPESFHEGICQWAIYWGYQWMQEDSAAYAALKRWETFMKSTINELDVDDDMSVNTFSVKVV